MSVIVHLDLPDDVAKKARAAGLLDPRRVATLIARELSKESDPRSFFELVGEICAQPGEPMTAEDIQAEIDTIRSPRDARH